MEETEQDKKYNLLTSSLLILLFFIFSFYINKTSNITESINNTIAFMGGSYFISSITTRPLTYFIDSTRPYIPYYVIYDSNKKKIYEIKKKFIKIKNNLNEHNINIFKKRIIQLDEFIYKNFEYEIKANIELLETMFFLEQTTDEKHDFDNFLIKSQKYLDTLDENTSSILKNNIFKPYIYNIHNGDYVPIVPLYLVGSPGTGKTYFVEKLSEILNIPIYNLEKNENLVHNCYGEISCYEGFNKKYLNTITKLLLRAKTYKKESIIFFIDELDKKITTEEESLSKDLLEFLNGTKIYNKNIRDEYLNYDIHIKNIIIICCGNKNFDDINNNNKDFKALKDRFLNINFNPIEKDLKNKIIYLFIKEKYPNIDIEKYKNYIDNIIEKDKEPGIRILINNIIQEINNLICKDFFKNSIWN